MAINKVATIDDQVAVKTVLVSVFDKAGLEPLLTGLLSVIPRLQVLSTGGTYAAIGSFFGKASQASLRQVSDYTGQPEMQGGLVKTLDYKLYLGLLSETHNADHQADLARADAVPIDMVVVNLYPFEQTVSRSGSSIEDARGYIDIGGPCMVRAAAKNYHRVTVLTDPSDYPGTVAEIAQGNGCLRLESRFHLAQKAFRMIAAYDAAIAGYLSRQTPDVLRAAYSIRDRA